MILLGIKERIQRRNRCRDLAEARCSQIDLVVFKRLQSRLGLRRVAGTDHRTVLRADVVSLPVSLRWIVAFPEYPEKLRVAEYRGIEDYQDNLGMTGLPGADGLIVRVLRVAT